MPPIGVVYFVTSATWRAFIGCFVICGRWLLRNPLIKELCVLVLSFIFIWYIVLLMWLCSVFCSRKQYLNLCSRVWWTGLNMFWNCRIYFKEKFHFNICKWTTLQCLILFIYKKLMPFFCRVISSQYFSFAAFWVYKLFSACLKTKKIGKPNHWWKSKMLPSFVFLWRCIRKTRFLVSKDRFQS